MKTWVYPLAFIAILFFVSGCGTGGGTLYYCEKISENLVFEDNLLINKENGVSCGITFLPPPYNVDDISISDPIPHKNLKNKIGIDATCLDNLKINKISYSDYTARVDSIIIDKNENILKCYSRGGI